VSTSNAATKPNPLAVNRRFPIDRRYAAGSTSSTALAVCGRPTSRPNGVVARLVHESPVPLSFGVGPISAWVDVLSRTGHAH
jgi:hypothetical protein